MLARVPKVEVQKDGGVRRSGAVASSTAQLVQSSM